MGGDEGQPTRRIISVQRDLAWMPRPNEMRLVLSEALPDPAKVTSVHAFAFAGDRLLMTRLPQRGWDIPGGHVEDGETFEQAVRREVHEETGATLGRLRPFGYQHMRVPGAVPADYRYPVPDSYLLLLLAPVAELGEFMPSTEATERRLFDPREAAQLPWIQKNRPIYDAALTYGNTVDRAEQL